MFNPLLRSTLVPLSLLGLAACGQATTSADQAAPDTKLDMLSQGSLLASTCSGCHSDQSGAIAPLDGYSETMLIEAMHRYKSETDGTTVMHRLARGYSDEDITEIGSYLGADEELE